MLGDPPVELDGSVLGEGLSTPQIRRRRGVAVFQKRPLKPLGADHDTHEPDGQMLLDALHCVRLPSSARNPDAGDEQRNSSLSSQPMLPFS